MCGIWQKANAAMAGAICVLLSCHGALAHTTAPDDSPHNGADIATNTAAAEAEVRAVLLKPSPHEHVTQDEEKAFGSMPLPIPGDAFSRGAVEEPAPTARQKGLLPNSWHDFINQDGFFGDPWGART
ncbi:MAG: hypothetical protein M3036_12455, partial [Bifidobacteriales bacterium]|nr:hypothetical protein [Bifidobacteriales bacterium]